MVLTYLTVHLKKNKFIPSPYTLYENKSQCIQDWNCMTSWWSYNVWNQVEDDLLKEDGNPKHKGIG